MFFLVFDCLCKRKVFVNVPKHHSTLLYTVHCTCFIEKQLNLSRHTVPLNIFKYNFRKGTPAANELFIYNVDKFLILEIEESGEHLVALML